MNDPFQTCSNQSMNGSAGAQKLEPTVGTCGPAQSSRKRSSSELDENKCISDLGLKRILSSPCPPSELLLSLGNNVPEAAAGVELSMKSSRSAGNMEIGELKGLGLSSSLNAGPVQNARSLNSGHHQELIARLLAAASASSTRQEGILQASLDPHVQALHGLGPPFVAQPHIFDQGFNPGLLTRVTPRKYLRPPPQGAISTLNDSNFNNTTLLKPYNNMTSDALLKPYPYYNINIIENDNINTIGALVKPYIDTIESIEPYNMRDVPKAILQKGLLSKMCMHGQVMVVMEGRSIERTLCLHDYDSYDSFAKALFEMFNGGSHDNHLITSPTTSPPCIPTLENAIPGYKIAYQDYEGDLLLVGDLPWREFIRVAKQIKILRIMKSKNIQSTHCIHSLPR